VRGLHTAVLHVAMRNVSELFVHLFLKNAAVWNVTSLSQQCTLSRDQSGGWMFRVQGFRTEDCDSDEKGMVAF
jgi:hypothetical protein